MGRIYYVAADGTGDGSCVDTPMPYAQANAITFRGGDRVLFRRGDVFYGPFEPTVADTSDESRVEIGAYGEGALPIISRAKIVSSPWTDVGNGFYKFVLTKDGRYTGINDDNANVGFMKDAEGNYYGRRFRTPEECTQPYDLYCDESAVYVKSDKDPYAALGSLTMATFGWAMVLSTGMNVHDIHIQFCGYGMWSGEKLAPPRRFIHIHDCVIDDIGGAVADVNRHIRLGNAIELHHSADNVLIERNILRNMYDVAFTCQGDHPGIWHDITVRNNIIAYNTQAIEIWCGAEEDGTGLHGLTFADNLCIKNGEGWASHARASQHCDVLTYGYHPTVWQWSIENNTFYHSEDISAVCNIHPPALEKFIRCVTMDHNQIYQLSEESNYLYNRANVGGPAEYAGLHLGFAEWQAFTGLDKHSRITYIGDNAKYAEMERVALTSLDFDEIARAAAAAGLSFTLAYDATDAQGYSLNG